jgi:hypothetical protein
VRDLPAFSIIQREICCSGLLHSGICGRRLESCWSNGRTAYRCRHGHSSASAPALARSKTLYVMINTALTSKLTLTSGGAR